MEPLRLDQISSLKAVALVRSSRHRSLLLARARRSPTTHTLWSLVRVQPRHVGSAVLSLRSRCADLPLRGRHVLESTLLRSLWPCPYCHKSSCLAASFGPCSRCATRDQGVVTRSVAVIRSSTTHRSALPKQPRRVFSDPPCRRELQAP